MKKIFTILLAQVISFSLFSQCDGVPSQSDLIAVSFSPSSNGTSGTVQFIQKAVIPSALNSGIVSLYLASQNPVTYTGGNGLAGLTHAGSFLGTDLGLVGDTRTYHQFTSATTINPSTFFTSAQNMLNYSFSGDGGIIEIVLLDIFPPKAGTPYTYYRTGVQVCSQLEDNLVLGSNVSLPILLQSFTAQKLNYNSSLLNWKSLSEEDASHFDIEKSLDAENWVKVGTEKTRGSLNYGAEYSFVDENAVLLRNDENTVYYRLKMVDNDGSFQYSDVRLVTFERSLTDVEVYPNPSHEFFNWKMGVGDTQVHDAQLQLFDMTGKLVKKQTVSANGISKVDIAELETGLYNIVVKHEDQIYRKRIIKTN